MQFAVTAALFAALAAAAPAAIVSRDGGPVSFTVSNFHATCEVNGQQCEYSFNLAVTGTQGPGPNCDLKLGKPLDGSLPAVLNAGCDAAPGLTWHVEKKGDGSLRMTAEITGTHLQGAHTISTSELTTDSQGVGSGQRYKGDKTFNLQE